MYKSCQQLLTEFNIACSVIPQGVHAKILRGEGFSKEECEDRVPEVRVAVELWNEINARIRVIPQYELMLQ